MPELPEAEVAARQLRERVIGATVRDFWVGRDDIVREGLSSVEWYRHAQIMGVERRGKSVILTFVRDGHTRFLAAELGMTGLLIFRSTPTGIHNIPILFCISKVWPNPKFDTGIHGDLGVFRYSISRTGSVYRHAGLGMILSR